MARTRLRWGLNGETGPIVAGAHRRVLAGTGAGSGDGHRELLGCMVILHLGFRPARRPGRASATCWASKTVPTALDSSLERPFWPEALVARPLFWQPPLKLAHHRDGAQCVATTPGSPKGVTK